MKPLEFSKQIVSKTVRKSWDVATAPTRISLHTMNAFVGLIVDNSEYSNQRKQIAERLGNLHQSLKQSTEKVQYRMAGETEVYSVKMNESNTIILYYRKQKAGYKVSVEQRLMGDYRK
ncbi:MAG TPA: hypothetical protein PKH60_03555, partial [Candidatus Woesebacteria bacterium]|nr:hypothetical protein [Candidatus Woesebacteria bacterium]